MTEDTAGRAARSPVPDLTVRARPGLVRGLLAGTVAAGLAGAVALVPGLPAVGAGAGAPVVRSVACDSDALIEALLLANAGSGGTLSLARQCTYTLTVNQDGNGLPPITQAVNILGNDARLVREATAAPFRVFNVRAGGDLTLRGLTVAGGSAAAAASSGGAIRIEQGGAGTFTDVTFSGNNAQSQGGAVFNAGSLSLVECVLRGNASGLDGGAVFNTDSLTVDRSRLEGNSSTNGGALTAEGKVTIRNSTLAGNHATGGGAIDTRIGPISLTIDQSTISGNSASRSGGAISTTGETYVRHSTVDGNTAGQVGGGIFNLQDLTVEDSRITGNTATTFGGGIDNGTANAQAVIRRSEVSGNTVSDAGGVAGGIGNRDGTLVVNSTRITDNVSTTAPGGVFTTTPVTVDNASTIVRNRPTNCAGSPVPVPNCSG
ncbi:right-handed parallel beta-helix repeat-containing protein [Rugosimonospora africana]|nr:right-handed parallel beta-helix repeat-containing protein [Rugosimonospora africana]